MNDSALAFTGAGFSLGGASYPGETSRDGSSAHVSRGADGSREPLSNRLDSMTHAPRDSQSPRDPRDPRDPGSLHVPRDPRDQRDSEALHVLHAPRVPRTPERSSFEAAHAFTARWEGALADHPDDPGGVTNFGVSLRFLQAQGLAGCICPLVPDDSAPAPAAPDTPTPAVPNCAACEVALSVVCVPYPDTDADGDLDAEDIRRLSPALAARILRRAFWDSFPLDAVPPICAFALYDCAVNLGVGRARRLMQKALSVEPDGRWGPVTWAAIRACETPERDIATARELCRLRREYYEVLVRRSPKMRVFLKGWLARVQALLEVLQSGTA